MSCTQRVRVLWFWDKPSVCFVASEASSELTAAIMSSRVCFEHLMTRPISKNHRILMFHTLSPLDCSSTLAVALAL